MKFWGVWSHSRSLPFWGERKNFMWVCHDKPVACLHQKLKKEVDETWDFSFFKVDRTWDTLSKNMDKIWDI